MVALWSGQHPAARHGGARAIVLPASQDAWPSPKLVGTLRIGGSTTPPAAAVVSVAAPTSSTVGLAWDPVVDDDSTCCKYRIFANGVLVTADNLQWTGERAVTVLRLAAATTHSFTIVAVDPSGNASAPSAAVTATTQPTTDTTGPTAPGDLSAFDFGCETWLFWNESVDDVDPQHAIRYEVRVNGVFDGAQTGIDRWITYGTQTSKRSVCRRSTAPATALRRAPSRSPTRPAKRRTARRRDHCVVRRLTRSSEHGRPRMAAPGPWSRSWPRSWDRACAGRRRRPGRRGARTSARWVGAAGMSRGVKRSGVGPG